MGQLAVGAAAAFLPAVEGAVRAAAARTTCARVVKQTHSKYVAHPAADDNV
jgi:hypothetical protein